MNKGKEKCEILKAIRTYIANQYGLDYIPSACTHQGECQGTCCKCDTELAYLQRQLEAKGITDISTDTTLSKMVEQYLSKIHDNSDIPPQTDIFTPTDDAFTLEGMPQPLQGDIAAEEEGIMPAPYPELEGETRPITTDNDKRKLFMECPVAGIFFHDIDDIWDELQVGTKLALVREKKNTYDKNAVAVALVGDYDGNPDNFDFNFIIGYVPRKDNEPLAAMLDMGWQDLLEAEICELNAHSPYSDRIHIAIYIKDKDLPKEDESPEANRLRMMVFEDEEWQKLADQLWQNGYAYFWWGTFQAQRQQLPQKGDKVVFLHEKGTQLQMYLMQTVAVGEKETEPFMEGCEESHLIDDRTVYVLTNIAGPVTTAPEKLQIPIEQLKCKCLPSERLPIDLSNRLTNMFHCQDASWL